MAGSQKCPRCGTIESADVKICGHCKFDIASFWSDINRSNLRNNYSKLEAEEKNSGWLLPVLILSFSVLLMSFLIVFLGTRHGAEIEIVNLVEDDSEETEQFLLEGNDNDNGVAADIANNDANNDGSEDDNDQDAGDEEQPPDHALLEEEIYEWLKGRVNDPDLILLHTDDLEDTDSFIEQQEKGVAIIVYEIESTEGKYVTVLFGYPFTEWSIRAVFTWSDNRWEFLREESVY